MKKRFTLLTLIFLAFSSILLSQDFEIYVCDAGNFNNPPYQILKFDSNGANGEVFINSQLAWPQDIVFLEDQNVVLISNLSSGRITRHNASNGDYIDNFATGIGGPTRMEIRNDTLFVLQWNATSSEEHVLIYDLDGNSLGNFTSSGIFFGIGLDWDSNGHLYVSSYGNASNPPVVKKFDASGSSQGNFIGSSDLNGPTNIWFDPSGNGDLLVVDYNAGNVKRFNSNGGFENIFISGLSQPEGVDFLPDGKILLGNGGTDAVKLFESNGTFIKDLIPSGTLNLLTPNAVVLRDIAPVSISDPMEEVNHIFPTIGTTFFIDKSIVSEIQSIEIYNASGGLIKKEKLQSNTVWDASKAASGLYLIRSKKIDGKVLLQKIMVEK